MAFEGECARIPITEAINLLSRRMAEGHSACMKAYSLSLVGREDALCRVNATEGAHEPVNASNLVVVKVFGHSTQNKEKEALLDAISKIIET